MTFHCNSKIESLRLYNHKEKSFLKETRFSASRFQCYFKIFLLPSMAFQRHLFLKVFYDHFSHYFTFYFFYLNRHSEASRKIWLRKAEKVEFENVKCFMGTFRCVFEIGVHVFSRFAKCTTKQKEGKTRCLTISF